jgi:sulfatase maturation enzyme AslB (radical SAM superfamily)
LQVLVDTNGVLLNQKIAELFKKYNVKVTVALDGVKKINDSYRVCNNKGTFENVLKSMKLLKKLGITTYVSTMAVPEYYNKKTVDEFCYFLSKYNIKLMGMNLPKGQESWKLLKKERKQSRDDYQKKAVIFMINF